MGFYYTSLFSIVPLGIAYGALALLYWALVRGTRGMRARWAVLGVAAPILLAVPIAEEVWIAWNFGQACKEAGTFIHKKVQVEGFYDDTTHWWRQLKESSTYRFVESRDNQNGNLWRVERNGNGVKHFRIDRPTARYHFKATHPIGGTWTAHKVGRSEWVVLDAERNEEIARYTVFGRRPPWFFIWLDTPAFACDEPGKWPLARGNSLIYRDVLIPIVQR